MRAIESIVSQKIRCEIIVVDDASDPPFFMDEIPTGKCTIQIVRRKSNGGAGAARNTGIISAKGKYLSFLDSDDRMEPDTLGLRMNFFKRMVNETSSTRNKNGAPFVVCSGWHEVSIEGVSGRSRLPRPTSASSDFFTGCWFSPGSTMICERELFMDTVGAFDERLARLEDLDWFIRFSLAGGELKVQPVFGVAIEITRDKHLPSILTSVEKISQKYQILLHRRKISNKEFDLLKAYLCLETATAHWQKRNFLSALFQLVCSFAIKPRIKRHFSPGWHGN